MAPSETFTQTDVRVNTGPTISSDSSNELEVTGYNNTTSTCGMSYYTSYLHKYDNYENEEKIWKTILLEEMKWGWRENHKEFNQKHKVRPSIQLRNVCADGRGWAC